MAFLPMTRGGGSTKCVKIITNKSGATSNFDVSTTEIGSDYTKLTTTSFLIVSHYANGSSGHYYDDPMNDYVRCYLDPTITYNPQTGLLSITNLYVQSYGTRRSDGSVKYNYSVNVPYDVWAYVE